MITFSSAIDIITKCYLFKAKKINPFCKSMWLAVDGGEITTVHIILGIWSEVDSPGHKILSTLGFNDEKAKELETSISKPGFKDDWCLL